MPYIIFVRYEKRRLLMQKQVIKVYPFTYNKILGGQRKIDVRPYVPQLQTMRVGDMLEYHNLETGTTLVREIKGIALFPDFDTLIRLLPPEMIGYATREEVRVRLERMYPQEDVEKYGACALFIEEPDIRTEMKLTRFDRTA